MQIEIVETIELELVLNFIALFQMKSVLVED